MVDDSTKNIGLCGFVGGWEVEHIGKANGFGDLVGLLAEDIMAKSLELNP